MESPKSELKKDRNVLLEPEEYEALLAELPPPEEDPGPQKLEERVKKIEFCMLIVVTLVLIIFLFFRH
jgi:hypothetical protein